MAPALTSNSSTAPEPRIPYDVEAESWLLGGLIVYPATVAKMPSELDSAWWDPDHRRIYAALKLAAGRILEHSPELTPPMLARICVPADADPLEQQRLWGIICKCCGSFPPIFDKTCLWYAEDVLQLADRRHRMEEGAKMVAEAWTDRPSPGRKPLAPPRCDQGPQGAPMTMDAASANAAIAREAGGGRVRWRRGKPIIPDIEVGAP